jgi:acyl-CoA synthetase (AMP-forming)/AMP-acid ligase II
MLIHDYVNYYSRNNPDMDCVRQGSDLRSYAQISKQSNQVANGLILLGVKHSQRVAILGENSPDHFSLFLAAGKIGVVSVPLNYRLAPAELAFVIGDAKVKVLLVLAGMESTLEALRDFLPDGITVISHGMSDSLDWHSWVESQSSNEPSISVDSNDPFIQLYTSGTTGNPKGVVISHHNLLSLVTMNNAAAPARPNAGESAIICAPLFHIGGTGSLIMAIFSGQTALLHKVFDPMQVLDDMEQHPVTAVFLVPAMIGAMLQTPNVEQRDFSKLRQIFYGASPISETLLRQAMGVLKCDFIQMYGMTETTGTVINLSADDHRLALTDRPELLRAAGRPSVGVKAKIVDDDGIELVSGEIGELWIKSDTNMLAYDHLPEATAETLTDGWVHTGDAGYIDQQGYIFLKDRIKDMVVSGAENIYPVEVENAIAKHPAVLEVIGVPDEKFGEALLAFIVLKPKISLTCEELVDFCRDKIAGFKIPRQLEVINELPRNATGKILKKTLREPYWKALGRDIA